MWVNAIRHTDNRFGVQKRLRYHRGGV